MNALVIYIEVPNTCKRQPSAYQRIPQGKMSYSFCAGLTLPGGIF